MRTFKIEGTITYDPTLWHGDKDNDIKWFFERIMSPTENYFYNAEAGDFVGQIIVTHEETL